MELNRADKVCFDFKIDDGQFMENCPDVKRQNFVNDESDEGSRDIVDLLPNDPFGMELNIALPSDPFVMGFEISLPKDPFEMDFEIGANLFTSWIEDFSVRGYELDADQASENEDKDIDDSKIVAGLNFYWASSLMYEHEDGGDDVGLKTCTEDVSNDNSLGGGGENLKCFGQEKNENYDTNGGEPTDALLFVLGYLGVKDLLTLERVCKSLFDAVRDETLVWKNITIDYALSDKITNDGLLQLTNRAKGTLCSLSLLQCVKITNTGLKEVLERNPGLTKLSVQGCNKLSVEGILHDLKAFNSDAMSGIKRLRIGHMTGLTNQHFEDFKFLLGLNDDKSATNYKPRYYRAGEMDLSLEDERSIDIETCPRCQQPRLVYDCPSDSCEEKIHSAKACRGCILCISRCIGCGCCLDNKAYEETFFLDSLCLECLHHLLNSSGGHTYLHKKSSVHFFLCG